MSVAPEDRNYAFYLFVFPAEIHVLLSIYIYKKKNLKETL